MNQSPDDLLIHVTRRAMACEFEVCFPARLYEQGTEWALEALDRVEELERRISYFQPGSEISRINLLAAEQAVEIEPDLFALLDWALRLADETGGAYDITSAPLWETWGFARRSGRIPADAELAEARSLVGRRFVELDPERKTIRFLKPGMKINLGSIGKGHALDLCAAQLESLGMADFLLHGGQSSILAHGQSYEKPWEINLKHPQRPSQRLGVIRLNDRALGTSGSQFQSFRHQGRRYGHIIDPRTGRPAQGLLSATVLAPTAASADALSTAFYVLGASSALDYCGNHPERGAVLIEEQPGRGKAEFLTSGLKDGDFAVD